MINRHIQQEIVSALHKSPVVAILGARQIGKTTLAHTIAHTFSKECLYLDLERPSDLNKLSDPEFFFHQNLDKTVILDEIQRVPELLPIIRSLVDQRRRHHDRYGHYLLLGSSSQHLLRYSSESLAGRIRYMDMAGFNILEVPDQNLLWLKGGFPESYLTSNLTDSFDWRENLITTYVEREMYISHHTIDPALMRRFWKMLAYNQGELFNGSKLAASLGVSTPTVFKYLDILVDLFMVRILKPWHNNIGKRLVKTPKIYVRDSGLLHCLLGLKTIDDLLSHPILGGSFEGFVMENIKSFYHGDLWFYRTSAGAEMDLIFESEKIGVEIKRSLNPIPSKGLYQSLQDLELNHAYIIYPGEDTYSLSQQVTVISLKEFLSKLVSKSFQKID